MQSQLVLGGDRFDGRLLAKIKEADEELMPNAVQKLASPKWAAVLDQT